MNLKTSLRDFLRRSLSGNSSKSKQNDKSFNWRRFLLSVGLIIGLVLFLRQVLMGYLQFRQSITELIQPIYLVVALASGALMYVFQIMAWIYIMRHLGIKLDFRRTFKGYLLSFLPRYVPGTVWAYLSRGQWLKQTWGVDYSTSALGSILEAAVQATTAAIVGGLFSTLYESRAPARALMIAASGTGLILTWLILPRIVLGVAGKVTGREPIQSPSPSRAWAATIGCYLGLWMAFGGSVLALVKALIPSASGNFPGAVSASSLAWLLGFVAVFIPTGIGVRETAMGMLLVAYVGLLPAEANLVAVSSRIMILSAELGWITFAALLHLGDWFTRRRRKENRSR
jgi:hypothetical protein